MEAAIGSSRRGEARVLDFRVGIADSVPKAIAYRLLEPALARAGAVRLICHEGKFQELLARWRCTGSTWSSPTSRWASS